jgi:hypothetical protein
LGVVRVLYRGACYEYYYSRFSPVVVIVLFTK